MAETKDRQQRHRIEKFPSKWIRVINCGNACVREKESAATRKENFARSKHQNLITEMEAACNCRLYRASSVRTESLAFSPPFLFFPFFFFIFQTRRACVLSVLFHFKQTIEVSTPLSNSVCYSTRKYVPMVFRKKEKITMA